jgi:hypothetical protein
MQGKAVNRAVLACSSDRVRREFSFKIVNDTLCKGQVVDNSLEGIDIANCCPAAVAAAVRGSEIKSVGRLAATTATTSRIGEAHRSPKRYPPRLRIVESPLRRTLTGVVERKRISGRPTAKP